MAWHGLPPIVGWALLQIRNAGPFARCPCVDRGDLWELTRRVESFGGHVGGRGQVASLTWPWCFDNASHAMDVILSEDTQHLSYSGGYPSSDYPCGFSVAHFRLDERRILLFPSSLTGHGLLAKDSGPLGAPAW